MQQCLLLSMSFPASNKTLHTYPPLTPLPRFTNGRSPNKTHVASGQFHGQFVHDPVSVPPSFPVNMAVASSSPSPPLPY